MRQAEEYLENLKTTKMSKGDLKVQRTELTVLLNEWDPIGASSFPGGPEDEYDCFIEPILSLLNKGTDKEKLTNFLTKYLEEHMDIPAKFHQDKDIFAEKVLKWWKSQE